MKLRVLLIAVVLAAFVHCAVFAQAGTDIEYNKLFEQVSAYIDTDNYAAAIPLLQRMQKLKPKEILPVEYLGIFYINLPEERPKFTNTFLWLSEAEKRGSLNELVYYNLACIYSQRKDIKKAESSMDKALALGYNDFEWLSQDDDLVNFKTGSWWKGIAKNYTQINQKLALFYEFTEIEDEKSITERVTFYNGIVTELKKLAPHIPALLCQPLRFLTVSYQDMGNYALADLKSLEEKTIAEKVLGKEHPFYAGSLNNLGVLYSEMGDYAKAERYQLEATAILEKAVGKEHPSYARSIENIGSLYADMGDYAKAERCYLESKAINEKVFGKENRDYATSLNRLGILYDDMNDYAKAESYYLEVKAIWEKILGKEHPDYAAVVSNLGVLYRGTGDYVKAERYMLEAKSIEEKALGKEHPGYATSLNNLGALYDDMGDYAKAERYYIEAKTIREKTLGKEHPDYAVSLDNLFLLYLNKKEYKKALTYKQEQINIKTGLVNKNFSFQTEQQRNLYWNHNSFSFELAYSLSFFNPVSASNILNYDNALFSKGLLLRTANAVRDAVYASGNKALIAQFEELGFLRQQINALLQSGGDEEYIKSLEDKAETLDKSLTQASKEFREFQEDLSVNWQNIKKSLQAKEAAIEFVSFEIYDKKWTDKTQYAALVVKPNSTAPVWVPLCEEEKIKEILSRAEGRNSSQQARIIYNANGLELFEAVWKPLEKELSGLTTVYYSPSGLLHKIALNALPLDDSFEVRLADKYNLNLVSSTREVVHLDRSPVKTTQVSSAVLYGGLDYDADENAMRKAAQPYKKEAAAQVAVSAPPEGVTRGGAWVALPATREEALNVQKYLNNKKIPNTLYQDSMGNEESFKQLSGKKTGLIHLATHGFFLPDAERKHDDMEQQQTRSALRAADNPLLRSGFLLAGGNHAWAKNPVEGVESGILTADKIASMNLLGAKLVVMSACQTGLGDVKNSEGVFGLQRAFKLAGVETLIMSLWEVDDEATAILMSTFYQEWLISGKRKQEAFKEAQKKVRAEYPMPFFWAAFVMMD